MLHRNAVRHLLFAVSILLLVFIVIGYTLRKRADSVGLVPESIPSLEEASAVAGASPGSGSLRPSGDGMRSDVDDNDLAGWIPSVGDSGVDLPAAASSAGSTRPSQAVASSPSGVITGLVPDLPTGAATGLRPETDTSEAVGIRLPADIIDGSDSGDAATDDGALLASLPVPGSGSAGMPSPVAPSVPAAGSVSPETSGVSLPVPPIESGGSGLTPPSSMPSGAVSPPGRSRVGSSSGGRDESSSSAEDEDDWDDTEPMGSRLTPPVAEDEPQASSFGGGATPSPPPTPPSPPEGESGSHSESLRFYIVRPGDTLTSIASRELGGTSLADNIFLLNRDVIDDPDHLLVGVKIRLPYASPLGGGGNGGTAHNQGLGRKHIVVRGDTLSSISLQYYGTSVGWQFLYESNRHVLPNPNQLAVGMELNIPPYNQ